MQNINEFSTRDQIFVGFFQCDNCNLQWNQDSIEFGVKDQCDGCQNNQLPYELLNINETLKIDETYTCIFKCVHGIIRRPNCRINQQYVACQQCNLRRFPDQILSNSRRGKKIGRNLYFNLAKFKCSLDHHTWEDTKIKLEQTRACPICRVQNFPTELSRGLSFVENQRYYGLFKCGDCSKTWSSSSSWLNVSQQCKCISQQFFFPYELRFRNRTIKSTQNQLFTAKFECIYCDTYWEKDQMKYGESDECSECNQLYFPYKLENDDIQFIDNQIYKVKYQCQCGTTTIQQDYMNQSIICHECDKLNYPVEVKIIEQNRRYLNHIEEKCSKCIRLGYSCMRSQQVQHDSDESSQRIRTRRRRRRR